MADNDLLAKLEEIQNSFQASTMSNYQEDVPVCIIDPDTRKIQMPDGDLVLGVESDEKAARVRFQCSKIVGNDIDLSKLAIRINYRDAEGNVGQNIAENITDGGETMTFDWIPARGVTKYKGTIQFIVCAINTEDGIVVNEWNTTLAKAVVLEGIEPDSVDIPYEEQDIIAQLIQQIQTAQKQTAQDAEASRTSASNASEYAASALDSKNAASASETKAKASEESAKEMMNKVEDAVDVLLKNSTNIQTVIDNLDDIKSSGSNAQSAAASAEKAEQAAKEAVGVRKLYDSVLPAENGNIDLSRPMATSTAESVKITANYDRLNGVKINGFTQQAGTGDPSPENVREISTAGMRMIEIVFDGSTDENWQIFGTGSGETSLFALASALVYNTQTPTIFSDRYQQAKIATDNEYQGISGWNQYFYLRDNTLKDVPSLKAELQNNPLSVWYVTADESQATGLYIPIQAQGAEYRCEMMKLTAPLCDGDKVESCVPSGCDKRIVFDGSADENWGISFQNNGFYIEVPDVVTASADNILTGAVLSDYLTEVKSASIYNATVSYGIALYTTKHWICLRIQGVTTADALKLYLQERPLTVWYRSITYTEADDIPVQLETHNNWAAALIGTEDENWILGSGGQMALKYSFPTPKQAITGNVSSHGTFGSGASVGNTMQFDVAGGYFNVGATFVQSVCDGTLDGWKKYLAALNEAGTPFTISFALAVPAVYARDPVTLTAVPDDTGSFAVSSQSGTKVTGYIKPLSKDTEAVKFGGLTPEQYSEEYSGVKTLFGGVVKDDNNDLDPSRPMTTAAAQESWTVKSKGDRIQSVRVNGFTDDEQSGGLKLYKFIVDGETAFSAASTYAVQIVLPIMTQNSIETKAVAFSSFLEIVPFRQLQEYQNAASVSFDSSWGNSRLHIKIDDVGNDAEKAKLYFAENPLTLYYAVSDESQATGLYIPIEIQGSEYRCQCLPITEALGAGGNVQSCVPSGCDTQILINGSADISSVADIGSVYRIAIRTSVSAFQKPQISSEYLNLYDYTVQTEHFYVQNRAVFVFLTKSKLTSGTAEAAKQFFGVNPFTIWLRTENYTEQSDLSVSLETHTNGNVYAHDPVILTAVPYTSADSDQTAGTYTVSSQNGTTVAVSLKAMQDGGDAATLGGKQLNQIQTDALESAKKEIEQTCYSKTQAEARFQMPVGYIFDWAPVSGQSVDLSTPEKVAQHFGYGTWKELNGVFTFARKDGYAVGSTGGEEKHILTINEMPSHTNGATYTGNASSKTMSWLSTTPGAELGYEAIVAGGGQAHNNMPPYLTVYKWQRIA